VSPEEPQGAAEFAAAHDLPARAFAPQVWGAYLGWRLWPRYSVMVGPIIEIHPQTVWADYLAIAAGRDGWDSLLGRYAVDLLVLDAKDQARLVGLARGSSQWIELYADRQAAIFQRTGAGSERRQNRETGTVDERR
jgi:hypothetical protein